MDDELTRFAQTYQRFMESMSGAAWAEQKSPVRELVDGHLGLDSTMIPVVTESFAPFDHVNVQVAMSACLAAEGRTHELIGLTGQQRHYGSLSDLLETAHIVGVRIGAVDLVNLPAGPDDTLACVQFGLFFIENQGARLAVLMRGPSEHSAQYAVTLEVLCADRDRARALLHEVRERMVELNVFRNQVITFGDSHMGHPGLGPVVFYHRPDVARDGLVLADGVLEAIERQVLGIASQRERLRESGQHVKRGLLLHGPPGNGKTLTVRYLVANARDHTVLLLTGGGLHLVRPACALARLLQPSIVVLEDVDLVAEERGVHPGYSNPVLFDVLNVMDGIEEDADVSFLLTTNRADLLEPALAARPGRVDLAVEIELPEDEARRRLIELYGRGLGLHLAAPDAVVRRTSGVAASFVKELMRKAALIAALAGEGSGRLTVTDQHVGAALDELLVEEAVLTRALLGGAREGERARRRPGTEWLLREEDSPEDS